MTVVGRLFERRSLENPSHPLTSTAIAEWFEGAKTHSGVRVTEETSLRLIAVYRCVELIAGTCAALPLKAYRRGSRERVTNLALEDPHPELTSFEVWEIAYASLLLWGNAYFRKLRDGAGRIRYLWPLHPSRVEVQLVDPGPENPGGKVFCIRDGAGEPKPYTSREILHIPGLGYDGRVGLSRIQLAKQGIGLGLASEQYAARFFGSGSMMSGILTTDKALEQTSADRLKERWRQRVGGLEKAHEVAVLDNGAKFQPVSIPPKDAELLGSQNWSTTQIARLFGLPPHAIGDVERSTSWGEGIEALSTGMVKFTLQPSYLTRVEQRVTKEVLLDPNTYAEYAVEGLLRGDSAARANFYAAMVRIRAMNPNEVRVRENLEPYEGGDEFLNPNITDAPDDGDEDARVARLRSVR